MDTVIEVCAGLDVHKESVTANVRSRDERARRQATARQFGTMTAELLELSDWLRGMGVTHAAMEATAVYCLRSGVGVCDQSDEAMAAP